MRYKFNEFRKKIFIVTYTKKYKHQKTVKQHYIKCSKELYFATMKPTMSYIGKDGFQMNDKQADIFAECFTRKKYDYELSDSSEAEPGTIKTSETERDIERDILNTCIKLSLGKNDK